MTQDTTPTSGAADLPEALRRSTAADGKTELFNLPGYPLMVRAADFNRIHTESEMRRAALLDEMQKAALAAGQATAAQQGVAYAALPEPYCNAHDDADACYPDMFSEHQMRAFADATHAMRASPGQAPAVAYTDSTPHLKVGDSSFESWYAGYVKEGAKGLKRHCRDAYAAGMGDPLVGATPTPQSDSVQEDAACWHWLAEYLVGTRTDLDDEIVASETVNDLRKLVEAAIKQGATK